MIDKLEGNAMGLSHLETLDQLLMLLWTWMAGYDSCLSFHAHLITFILYLYVSLMLTWKHTLFCIIGCLWCYKFFNQKIGGRVVRVNEVHTRGGRPNFHRENFHRNADRDDDWERGRERERDHIQDRDHYLDRNNERFRDRDRQRERETDFERGRDFDRARAHSLDRDRDREDDDHERPWERNRDREADRDMDWNGDRDLDKNKDHDIDKELDKEQQPRQRHG